MVQTQKRVAGKTIWKSFRRCRKRSRPKIAQRKTNAFVGQKLLQYIRESGLSPIELESTERYFTSQKFRQEPVKTLHRHVFTEMEIYTRKRGLDKIVSFRRIFIEKTVWKSRNAAQESKVEINSLTPNSSGRVNYWSDYYSLRLHPRSLTRRDSG